MCGIVGYIGRNSASEVLMDRLGKLSYRGYDSAGIAVIQPNGKIAIRKRKGKIDQLESLVEESPITGFSGIGHTRWATHGEPSDLNAHPHVDVQGDFAVVHNGIIDNYQELRYGLEKEGVVFVSQTDTEVIAHLLSRHYNGDMVDTLLKVQKLLRGSYAIAALCAYEPDSVFGIRLDNPLVAGSRNGDSILSSDIPALLAFTKEVAILQDLEVCVLKRNEIEIYDENRQKRKPAIQPVEWEQSSAEKDEYAHYMLKEIHEQPSALRRTFAIRGDASDFSWLPLTLEEARKICKVSIVACGTAYHAGLVGKYAIEQLACIQTEVDYASEYRYRRAVVCENELLIAISQSGETADTLAATREAQKLHIRTICICNVQASSLAREVGERYTLHTSSGPEIAVASTKAYVTQVQMLLMVAVALGRMKGVLSTRRADQLYQALEKTPENMQRVFREEKLLKQIVNSNVGCKHVFYVGRGLDYAVAMEGALKLKEISYIFSEAYAAGELKHGPLALLEAGRLVIGIVTQQNLADKTVNNLQEVKARGAKVFAICTEKLEEKVQPVADEMLIVPDTDDYVAPLLAAVPLQLFAYYMVAELGCDVDQPKNLAKSVTVE